MYVEFKDFYKSKKSRFCNKCYSIYYISQCKYNTSIQ